MARINYGDHYVEKNICDFIRSLNGGTITMTSDHLSINKNGVLLETSVSICEEDVFTITWVGKFLDGTQFRVVKPKKQYSFMFYPITIASMFHDGYAVQFNLN